MGSKGGSNTVTQQSAPPPQFMQAYTQLLGQGNQVASQPLQQYGGNLVAGFTPDQANAFSQVEQASGIASPFYNTASQYAALGATPSQLQQFSGDNIQQYQNPFTQQVIDTTMGNINQQNQLQQQNLLSQGIKQGNAFGGDRAGLAQSALANQQDLAKNQTIAGLESQGYGQALGEFNTQQQTALQKQANDAARAAQASYQFGNIGQGLQGSALTGANALLNTGQQQQQLAQQQLNVPYGMFTQQQAYPFQTTNFLAGLTSGLGSQAGGSSQTTGPGPSQFGQMLGLGQLGLGAYNAFGGASALSGGGAGLAGLGALGADAGAGAGLGSLAFLGMARGGSVPHYDAGGQTGLPGDPMAMGIPLAGLSKGVPNVGALSYLQPLAMHGAGPPAPPKMPMMDQNKQVADIQKQGMGLVNALGKMTGDKSTGPVNDSLATNYINNTLLGGSNQQPQPQPDDVGYARGGVPHYAGGGGLAGYLPSPTGIPTPQIDPNMFKFNPNITGDTGGIAQQGQMPPWMGGLGGLPGMPQGSPQSGLMTMGGTPQGQSSISGLGGLPPPSGGTFNNDASAGSMPQNTGPRYVGPSTQQYGQPFPNMHAQQIGHGYNSIYALPQIPLSAMPQPNTVYTTGSIVPPTGPNSPSTSSGLGSGGFNDVNLGGMSGMRSGGLVPHFDEAGAVDEAALPADAVPASAIPTPQDANVGTQRDMTPYQHAIHSVESIDQKDPYATIGPPTKSGDRALGKYQVMSQNIPGWTAEALGQPMSAAEFLHNKEAQDAVFNHKFGQYLDKFGNPQDAASMWFAGRPLAQAGNASDGYTTTPQYVSKFTNALQKYSGGLGGQPQDANMPMSYADAGNQPQSPAQGAIGTATTPHTGMFDFSGFDQNQPMAGFNKNQQQASNEDLDPHPEIDHEAKSGEVEVKYPSTGEVLKTGLPSKSVWQKLVSGEPFMSKQAGLALMQSGLSTMAAASRPGATALGALGEGGSHGLQSYIQQTQLADSQQAVEQALVQQGVDPQQAHAMAISKEYMGYLQHLQTARQQESKPVQIQTPQGAITVFPQKGSDGKIQYFPLNPDGKTISTTPIAPKPPLAPGQKEEVDPAQTAWSTMETRAASAPASKEARSEEYLATLAKTNPRYAADIKAVANYEMAPTTFSLRNNTRVGAMGDVKLYDPTYDQTQFANKQLAVNRFGSGVQGNQVRSFNVSLEHLGLTEDLLNGLQNGDTRLINQARNAIKTQLGYGGPPSAESAKLILGDEIAKAVIGGQNAEKDRQGLQQQLSTASSPEQIKSVAQTFRNLMAGQLIGLKQQYETSTGLHNFDRYLTPRAKAAFAQSSVSSYGAPAQGQAPVQVSSPDEARKLPKGTPITLPDGRQGVVP